MKEIILTKGQVALVDDADYEWLMQWKWHVHKSGGGFYAVRAEWDGEKQHIVHMSRVILDAPRGKEVDHKNHCTLDNRRCNLRICTKSQNQHNQIKQKRSTSSVYKGVYWDRGGNRWQSRIKINGHSIYLGNFCSESEAALIYNDAAIKYHGEFAKLNEVKR